LRAALAGSCRFQGVRGPTRTPARACGCLPSGATGIGECPSGHPHTCFRVLGPCIVSSPLSYCLLRSTCSFTSQYFSSLRPAYSRGVTPERRLSWHKFGSQALPPSLPVHGATRSTRRPCPCEGARAVPPTERTHTHTLRTHAHACVPLHLILHLCPRRCPARPAPQRAECAM